MLNNKINLAFLIGLSLAVSYCGKARTDSEQKKNNEDETEKPLPADSEKPVALWIDAHANFIRFKTKANLRYYLDKAKEAGFNRIIVDVKPINSSALYNSDFLPDDRTYNGQSIDYDYVHYMIEQAGKRGMKVSLSATIMTLGENAQWQESDPDYWNDKYCIENLPHGLVDIRKNPKQGKTVFPFLNPVLPQVHDYVIRMVKEIVSKYEIKSLVLDYCRYPDIRSDFSKSSRKAFEKYVGVTLKNFPDDIYKYTDSTLSSIKYGPYFNKWVEWRAFVIKSYVSDIRKAVKETRPKVEIEYWAGSWWQAIYDKGQNWASPKINATAIQADLMPGTTWWASSDYYKQGFADLLDVFQLGAYLEQVYGPSNPSSIEFAIKRAKSFIGKDCKIYGTFSVTAKDPGFTEKAAYYCYKNTDGLMVFELSHIEAKDKWNQIKTGITKAKDELSGN